MQIILFILHKEYFWTCICILSCDVNPSLSLFLPFQFFYLKRSRLFPILVYTFFVERFARLSIKIDPSSKTFHHRFAACDEGLCSFFSLRVLIKSINLRRPFRIMIERLSWDYRSNPCTWRSRNCRVYRWLANASGRNKHKKRKGGERTGVNPKDWVLSVCCSSNMKRFNHDHTHPYSSWLQIVAEQRKCVLASWEMSSISAQGVVERASAELTKRINGLGLRASKHHG